MVGWYYVWREGYLRDEYVPVSSTVENALQSDADYVDGDVDCGDGTLYLQRIEPWRVQLEHLTEFFEDFCEGLSLHEDVNHHDLKEYIVEIIREMGLDVHDNEPFVYVDGDRDGAAFWSELFDLGASGALTQAALNAIQDKHIKSSLTFDTIELVSGIGHMHEDCETRANIVSSAHDTVARLLAEREGA